MSGYPLLVNDPHRVQEAPSLRYWVHLNAPGWNVIGAGEPALPGVSIGHNDVGAWGLTIFGTDGEDLYVYDTNPANPLQYKYSSGWETMKVIHETIPVKGEAPRTCRAEIHPPWPGGVRRQGASQGLCRARRLAGDRQRALSRQPAHGPGHRPGRNSSKPAVSAAFRRRIWSGPTASETSAIRRRASRRNRPELRAGWCRCRAMAAMNGTAFCPSSELPHVMNPDKGFYNTSNEYQIPPRLAVSWRRCIMSGPIPIAPRAWRRCWARARKFTVADMVQLQNNDLSIPARSIVPLLRDLDIDDPAVRKAAAAPAALELCAGQGFGARPASMRCSSAT